MAVSRPLRINDPLRRAPVAVCRVPPDRSLPGPTGGIHFEGIVTKHHYGTLPVLLALLAAPACSSKDPTEADGSTGGTGSAVGGRSNTSGNASSAGAAGASAPVQSTDVGTFAVTVDSTTASTSILGKIYSAPYPTDLIETPLQQNGECAVFAFGREFCTDACTTTQVCTARDTCTDVPSLVSVGTVRVSGIGSSELTLSAPNNSYQYADVIAYPGFDEGATISLSASGSYFDPFQISTQGVAPIQLSQTSYSIGPGRQLALAWTPGSAAVGAQITVLLNISKHGGSRGYLKCLVPDRGSLTIPAEQVSALIGLGVAGYPSLEVIRSKQGRAPVPTGDVVLDVSALAKPGLAVDGYCSCFNDTDCTACSDSTKTVCDSVTKLCHAP